MRCRRTSPPARRWASRTPPCSAACSPPAATCPPRCAAYEADPDPPVCPRRATCPPAVEHAPTPQEFARHYAAFSHWMITPRPAAGAGMTFTVEVDVRVPMRDGVALATNVWRPAGPGRFPVLLVRTPYGKDDAGLSATRACRTCPRSWTPVTRWWPRTSAGPPARPGTFGPTRDEGRDGADTLAWLAGSRGADGAVGMWAGRTWGPRSGRRPCGTRRRCGRSRP